MKITKKWVVSLVFVSLFAMLEVAMFSLPARTTSADQALFNQQEGMNEIGAVYGEGRNDDLRVIIGRIINVVLGLLGVVLLALIVVAGFRYMTAAGNSDQTKKALAQIRDAVIGLVIVLAAWAISIFILRFVNRAVSNRVNL